VPATQLEPNAAHVSVGAHAPPFGTLATHVAAPPSASELQIPPAHTAGVLGQAAPGCTTTTASHSEVPESQSAAAAAGSQKKTEESHASPSAGSFVQVCVVPSQRASTGQTLASLQGPPIPTGFVQTGIWLGGTETEQTRLFAQSPRLAQSWPSAAGVTQVPHRV
jgi:hypothetical protein